VATVTRTATRTKTREQKIRNEHRRPPPGFIPGGGLRRAGTTSVGPAQFTITDTRWPTRPAALHGHPAAHPPSGPTRTPSGTPAQRPYTETRGPPTRWPAYPVACPPGGPPARWPRPWSWLSRLCPSVTLDPPAHVSRIWVHPKQTKHPSWRTTYVKCGGRTRPAAHGREGSGAGVIREARGPGGRGDVAGTRSRVAGRLYRVYVPIVLVLRYLWP
jgi:hypothetical protein